MVLKEPDCKVRKEKSMTKLNFADKKITFASSMTEFHYFEPDTVNEAISLLKKFKGYIFAGGTFILPSMRRGEIEPRAFINIKKIESLQFEPRMKNGMVIISSLSTLSGLESSDLLHSKCPVLCDASSSIASFQIRNLATLGGNVCGGGMDILPILIVLNATSVMRDERGQRSIPVSKMQDERSLFQNGSKSILLYVSFVPPSKDEIVAFRKIDDALQVGFRSLSLALRLKRFRKRIQKACIVLGMGALYTIRLEDAEHILEGSDGNGQVIISASDAALTTLKQFESTMDWYAVDIVRVILMRTLREVLS